MPAPGALALERGLVGQGQRHRQLSRCRAARGPDRVTRSGSGRRAPRASSERRAAAGATARAGGRRRPSSAASPIWSTSARRRAGSVQRGLERHQLVVAEPGEAPTRTVAGEPCSGRVVDDVGRLGPVEHPQGDAQVGVGADAVVDRAVRALGGQHQVHAEAAAPLGDVDQGVEEAGELGGQRGELVDHHDQAGQRPAPPPVRRGRRRRRRAAPARAGGSRRRAQRAPARPRCGSRSVTRPTVWGRSAQASNALPPL